MLRVLGEVSVDGPGALRSRGQRIILAALVIDKDQVVAADRLAELVWGSDQPDNPNASLQNHVSRLRRVLGDTAAVVAQGTGYRLEAAASAVDVGVFEAAFARACERSVEERIADLEEALDLWRGEPFTELDDPRAQAERTRLGEARRGLGEMLAESLLATNRIVEAVAELEALRETDPFDERVVEMLMRAHVQAGRKSEALDVFQRLRTAMVDELGLDPGPSLRELESAILTEQLVATRSDTSPIPPAEQRPMRTVHAPASSFVGRDADLQRVGDELARHRIVTLAGPGGVGKTRLSLHVAAASTEVFPDGVEVLELASLATGDQLADMMAATLDLQPTADEDALGRIVRATADRTMLLVLDNCEHLIDDVAALVDVLAQHTSSLRVLATSREPLNIDGELVVRIQPLEPDQAAVALFADRAGASSGFELDDRNRPLVVRICRAVDGLPLAIELAAARCPAMTLEEIIEGLDDLHGTLSRGRRTAPERHQSLRALVGWSVRELDPELASLFAQLSVFAGPFPTAGAAAVAGLDRQSAADRIAHLVDRSLLVERTPVAGRSRFGFLATVQAYAAELLDDHNDRDEVLERHTTWVLGQARTARERMIGHSGHDAGDDVAASLADLRVVHRRLYDAGDAARSLELAALLHFVAMFRMQSEVFTWIIATADRFGDVDDPNAETVLASASIGSWQSGDLDAAEHYANRAVDIASRSSHPGAGRGAAEASGDVAGFGGDDRQALHHFERALAISREQGDQVRIVVNLVDLSLRAGYLGELDRAEEALAEARRRTAGVACSSLVAWVAYGEGEAFAEIDPPRALRSLDEAIGLADEASALFIEGVAGLTRCGLHARAGEPDEAIRGMIAMLEHWQRGGAWVQQWITLRSVVDLLVRIDDHAEAAVVLGAIDASDSTAEISGPDASRMAVARAAIEGACPDAAALMATGAKLDQRQVVARALGRLERWLDRASRHP